MMMMMMMIERWSPEDQQTSACGRLASNSLPIVSECVVIAIAVIIIIAITVIIVIVIIITIVMIIAIVIIVFIIVSLGSLVWLGSLGSPLSLVGAKFDPASPMHTLFVVFVMWNTTCVCVSADIYNMCACARVYVCMCVCVFVCLCVCVWMCLCIRVYTVHVHYGIQHMCVSADMCVHVCVYTCVCVCVCMCTCVCVCKCTLWNRSRVCVCLQTCGAESDQDRSSFIGFSTICVCLLRSSGCTIYLESIAMPCLSVIWVTRHRWSYMCLRSSGCTIHLHSERSYTYSYNPCR